jgi:hypothetical protein
MDLLNAEVDAAHFRLPDRLLLLLAAQRDIAVLGRREGGRRGATVPLLYVVPSKWFDRPGFIGAGL